MARAVRVAIMRSLESNGYRCRLACDGVMTFAVARAGPILFGRTAHQGGGLFRALR